MVLGQVRPLLEGDEHVAVWAHVQSPEGDQPGLLSMTGRRCLVHWSPRDEATASFGWLELTAWELSTSARSGALLTMVAGNQRLEMVLPLSTGTRAINATRVVEHLARHAPAATRDGGEAPARPLAAEQRGWRGHARRVAVTVVGMLVVLLSAVFASPFVPGPGALTFLAGLAILAREYDWARDVHHWMKRKFDRLWRWLRERRTRRQAGRDQRRRARARAAQVPDLARARASREGGASAAGHPSMASCAPDLERAPKVQNE